jgi:hypothetical protein
MMINGIFYSASEYADMVNLKYGLPIIMVLVLGYAIIKGIWAHKNIKIRRIRKN